MTRPILARIHPDALAHNYRLAKQHAPQGRAMAVIKADGYGHGFLQVVAALPEADGFALLNSENALTLRDHGETRPLVLLEGFFDVAELRACAQAGIGVAIHHEAQLRMLETTPLPATAAPLTVWLKLNTGMNRLGFRPQHAEVVVARLRAVSGVRLAVLMTHFATADEPAGIAAQWAAFAPVAQRLGLPVSVANSAAILRHPIADTAWLRPGIMLYGCSPFAEQVGGELGLRPAMTLQAQLIGTQTLAAGESVGYGAIFTADKPMRVGVVACGYADGYPRIVPSGTPVLVDGQRSGTVGRVSMDMLAVDLTPCPTADVGSTVTLWGQGLPIETIAAAANTIGYELMCAVAPRVVRCIDPD